MSYYDALADSIPMDKDSKGFTRYYPPCRICGSPVYTWSYVSGTKYVCKECRTQLIAMERESKASTLADKKEGKLAEAIKRISKVTDVEPYGNAITWVSKNLCKPGWFQSTEEIMVALELIRRGVKAHHQVRVYDYRVDFVLPEYKVALEIDGSIFHNKSNWEQEAVRDEIIKAKLGDGWEVIRISDDNINTNVTKLLPAIKAAKAYRKRKYAQ